MDMHSKKISIAEWIAIGVFLAIILLMVGILIYRSVVASDWYEEKQVAKAFAQVSEKLRDPEQIHSIKIDGEGDPLYVTDIPADLFDEMTISEYLHIEDVAALEDVLVETCVVVFFTDDTQTSFYLTEDGEIYWGTSLVVECPALLDWYGEMV